MLLSCKGVHQHRIVFIFYSLCAAGFLEAAVWKGLGHKATSVWHHLLAAYLKVYWLCF